MYCKPALKNKLLVCMLSGVTWPLAFRVVIAAASTTIS
ncbi:GhoT/OrtT family toxin [Mucilaginibacter sp. AW1-3]